MTYTIKEQLIILLLNGSGYSVLSRYLKAITSNHQLHQKLNLYEIRKTVDRIYEYSNLKKRIHINLDPTFYHQLADLTIQAIMIGESEYPILWYEIYKPPIIFFYRGDLSLLSKPKVSVIGTRKITTNGKNMTQLIIDAFSKKQWVAVSGLALGIDAQVHQSAINHPNGKTIAIIPCGLNYYYPKANQSIQHQLEKHHLILSEYLPNAKPHKHQFIERNRLVAGIAKASVVIEAAQKSGSLITANYALQCNRELFVLPGRITDQQSMGCLELIEAGASPIININKLVNDIEQIFQYQGY
ncbi:DNA-processing protein DprA [Aerococcaceae bacterium WGS1372]